MIPKAPFAPYIVVARSFAVILGCLAIWWGAVELPVFWRESSIEDIATQIIAGDPFKMETLTQQNPTIDRIKRSAYCRAEALRGAAIIELRMSEAGGSTDPKSLASTIRSSLSCAPVDPFLWLALYSVEAGKDGVKPDDLNYLRMSYRLGPHEGWIVLKRSPLAFKVFQQLSPDLREDVINEFVAMLRDGHFADDAAQILIGSAWPQRGLILERLNRLPDSDRRRFADALDRRGYDLNVPGIGLAPKDSHRFVPLIRVPQ